MSSIAAELAAILKTVRRPGDFFVSGTTELLMPRLEVDGVGTIAFPLLPMQAEQLVAAAERAPYGRGRDTVVDTQVRRTWQIGAERVRIFGKHWERSLQAVVARVANGLGVAEPIAAELYKLLIYDEGSFFVSHRDTEKAPGMFATLVMVLPSISTGGELIVRHKDREARLDLRRDDPSEMAFAAFYADCVHEVLPVTSGCRLALVYNLLRKAKGPAPQPPSYETEKAAVASLLGAWARTPLTDIDEDAEEDDIEAHNRVPEKLIYPLEHAYTPAELAFDALKGVDAAVAGVLAAAAPRAGCDLHLALMSIEESGAAEYTGYGGGYRGRSSEPEFEPIEVFDRDATLSDWRRPDKVASAIGPLPFDDEELSPPDALEDMAPDQEEFQEATGNEGASFERTYRRAALVLWPSERLFSVLARGGMSATMPHFEALAGSWSANGEDPQSPLWQEAHDFGAEMVAVWRVHRFDERDETPSYAARMLAVLSRLGDTDLLAALLARIAAAGIHAKSDNEAAVAALGLFPPEQRAALLERLIVGTAAKSSAACANLLSRAVGCLLAPHELLGPATALVGALPGDPARAPKIEPWQERTPLRPDFVVDLFAALAPFDEALPERAVDHILAWPKSYGFDSMLVPALRKLMESAVTKSRPAVERLRLACVQHLRARAAEPLEPPSDWRRPSAVACKCERCAALSGFLDDPGQNSWVFKAAEPHRQHVELTIRQARCDVDTTTQRRGSPHSLICTKNQKSYERRAKQRAEDLANLKRLGASPGHS